MKRNNCTNSTDRRNKGTSLAGAFAGRSTRSHLGVDAISPGNEHSDSRSCCPRTTIRRRRLVHGHHEADEDELAIFRPKPRGAHTKIWRQEILISRYDSGVLCDAISAMRKLEHNVHQEESSVLQLTMLLSLIRFSVAMIVFLSFERWAFSPRNISASIAPDENVASKSIFQWLLSNIKMDQTSDQVVRSLIVSFQLRLFFLTVIRM
ncbi:hypothetical protein BDV41DRAFT_566939 [Aspergillus transmontanensis]|uniref:Uncharacterized protein n=1 Tax=Aspergillus transmontanensis TaxID=1034304 RepID=A0A5N6VN65_9EURO|nr:hypothetical protein BDV41DRAFT_566939 [Aspergillus transmontanensis]